MKKLPEIIEKGVPSGMPSVYVHGKINMASEMITDKATFVRLWGRARGVDVEAEWKLARKWRDQFDKPKKSKGAE
jgi:hypothetical protein